jgi:uncharacterized membrane protein
MKALGLTLENVTLDVFIACMVRGELRRLSAAATGAQLAAAWKALSEEFIRQCGGEQNGYLYSLRRREARLRVKQLVAAIAMAAGGERGAALLHMVGYAGTPLEAKAAVARDGIRHKEVSGELKQAQKAQRAGEVEMNDKYFTRWIVSVSKFMGYNIDRKATTVADFLEMANIFKESAKQLAIKN